MSEKFGGLQGRRKREDNKSIKQMFRNVSGQDEEIKLIAFDDLIPNDNPYPITELEDLIISIKQYGVEQSLLVQETEDEKYLIIGGHRRYFAVKEILKKDTENNYGELTDLYCKIIHKEENPILVKLRLHENNLQTRPLLKMEESEKLSVIEDYMSLLQQARKQNIEINGQKVKGKTRDLIAQRFNIAPSTAQILVEKIKNREKGTDFGTDKKTTLSDIEKIEKIISKLATQLDKLTASELEKIIQSKNMSEEKNKIFNVLFQSKMKL